MIDFIKKNITLILAFSLPLIVILAVALSVYIPSHNLSTNYNFIYASCTDGRNNYPYNCAQYLEKKYSVINNKLNISKTGTTTVNDYNSTNIKTIDVEEKKVYVDRIFLHNTEMNESREITPEEATALNLNNLITSPDGITVSSNYNYNGGEFFPFGGGRSTFGYYLAKGKAKNKLNLINSSDQYYYQNNFKFIGWVLPGRN
jgi:hypothetical protein